MKTRTILSTVAALAVAAVVLSPKTAWLPGLIGNSAKLAVTGGLEAAKSRIVQADPNNATFAFAEAGSDPAKLRDITKRFPDSALAWAAILRAPVNASTSSLMPREPDAAPLPPESQKRLAERGVEAVAQARAGGKLDPENAFFPAMEAVGWAAQGKKTEALQALHRAADKPRFDDGIPASVRGKLALLEAAQGRTPHVARMAVAASELYPHYAPLRSLVRVAQAEAVSAEKAGRIEEGFAIRQDIQRLGLRVRDDSGPFIGSLVGQAMIAISAGDPAGEKTPTWDKLQRPGESEEAAKARRLASIDEKWRTWCASHGHPERVDVLKDAQDYRAKTKGIWERAEAHNPVSVTAAMQSVALFTASALLFALAAAFGFGGWFWARRVSSPRWQERHADAKLLDIHPSRIVLPLVAGSGLGVAFLLLAGKTHGSAASALAFWGIGFLVLTGLVLEIVQLVVAKRKGAAPMASYQRNLARSGGLAAACLWILWAGVQLAIADREDVSRINLDAMIQSELKTLQAVSDE